MATIDQHAFREIDIVRVERMHRTTSYLIALVTITIYSSLTVRLPCPPIFYYLPRLHHKILALARC